MTDITTAPRWLRGPLRPFRSGQYRLLAASVVMSLFAAGVWLIALVWQVIAMGGGPTDLSFVAAATAVGMLATTLLGGVFADRIPQRRILLTVAAARTIAIGVVALLALGDLLALWHLVVVAFVLGAGNGFTFPAYSALLPSILPAEDLMAANGVEGMLRPTVMQAAGPAVASALIAASSPGAAIAVVALVELVGIAFLLGVRSVPLRRDPATVAAAPGPRCAGRPARRLRLHGPHAVAARDPAVRVGADPADHGPDRGAGAVRHQGPRRRRPDRARDRDGRVRRRRRAGLAGHGVAADATALPDDHEPALGRGLPAARGGRLRRPTIWLIAAAVFVVGVCFSAPMVIWGTLLQRRVPPHMLGRVSSLDFFVSLAFMPLSMAIAGPVSLGIGLGATFALAGLLPTAIAVLAIVLAKMPKDEIAHPLDLPPTGAADPPAAAAAADGAAHPPAAASAPGPHAAAAGGGPPAPPPPTVPVRTPPPTVAPTRRRRRRAGRTPPTVVRPHAAAAAGRADGRAGQRADGAVGRSAAGETADLPDADGVTVG